MLSILLYRHASYRKPCETCLLKCFRSVLKQVEFHECLECVSFNYMPEFSKVFVCCILYIIILNTVITANEFRFDQISALHTSIYSSESKLIKTVYLGWPNCWLGKRINDWKFQLIQFLDHSVISRRMSKALTHFNFIPLKCFNEAFASDHRYSGAQWSGRN